MERDLAGPLATGVRPGTAVVSAGAAVGDAPTATSAKPVPDARASSPVQDAIPEPLPAAAARRRPGDLSGITFVKRCDTAGGPAPVGTGTEGGTASVPCTADHAFSVAG